MEIARKMYRRAGVFWKEEQGGKPEVNPWGVKFSTMFHMSNDSGLFRTQEELTEAGLGTPRQRLHAGRGTVHASLRS